MTEEADKQINWSNKLYMLYENELWLSEQAQKGLLLKSFAKVMLVLPKESRRI